MKRNCVAAALTTLLLAGCYQQVVHTGAEPGPRVVQKPWVSTVVTGAPESSAVIDRPWQLSLVAGLVPPPEIEADERCSDGVAKVETRRSFLNWLVAALSSSLITPMHTTVTCAAARPAPDASEAPPTPERAERPDTPDAAGSETGEPGDRSR